MAVDANFFKRQIAGVEMWTWMALGLGVLLILSAYRSKGPKKQPGQPPSPTVGGERAPYVFLLPDGKVAPPDRSRVPQQPPSQEPVPPEQPREPDLKAFGFSWSPYTVLGLRESRKTSADTSPHGIAVAAYGLDKEDTMRAAYLGTMITQNNPGVDWSRPLKPGTTVQIPRLSSVPEGAQPTQYN